MCFFMQQTKSAIEVENRFNAKFNAEYKPDTYNGFTHPTVAAITNENGSVIDQLQWGLIPKWAKDRSIQDKTLNARIESIHEKPSFKASLNKRCIIPIDGFFEWQWLDEVGRSKQKYLLHLNDKLFGLAGLWSTWIDNTTGESVKTFTILTTEATGLLAKIHNSKKRMPIALSPDSKEDWLKVGKLDLVNDRLIASKV